MVAVYLLGHRVGDIEEPVVYFNHKAYDYNGNELTKGMPDPFVESLQHNSIIVQIPLLRGQVNNRLDKVLSVFDQSKADAYDKQIITVDAEVYAGDDDMQYIVRRLTAAAADAQMREDMNVEDEYYSAIENRDTALMSKDKTIAKQSQKITSQELTIAEQSDTINQQGEQIAQQKDMLRNLVNGMQHQGLTIDAIAQMTGKTTSEIKGYTEQ